MGTLSSTSGRQLGRLLTLVIACSLVLHFLSLALGRGIFDELRWVHHPVHSAVEMLGACIAVTVAAVLLGLEARGEGTSFNFRIAAALGGMGILDGLHAFCEQGNTFVWLRTMATFVGGVCFVLVWLPSRWARLVGRRWPAAVCTAAILIGCVALAAPATVPDMFHAGQFTPTAEVLHLVGGLGFFAAVLPIVRTYWRTGNADDLLFSMHCALFGAAAVMFQSSRIWDVPWWGWHVLRLLAYGVALAFVVHTDLRSRRAFTKSLEDRVRERTEQLTQANARLAREQSLLTALVENIPEPVFFKDRQGRFLRANRTMARDVGFEDPEQLLGKTDADIWDAEFARETLADEMRLMETGVPLLNKEEEPRRHGGTRRWVSVTKMPLRDETGAIIGLFGVAWDITRQKEQAQELEEQRQAALRLAQEAEAARRLAERTTRALAASNADLEQFAFAASHDLQEPLRAIAGYCQLLQRQYTGRLDARADEYIRHAVEGVERMNTLIYDLLEFARVSRRREPFQMIACDEAVQEALARLKTALEESKASVRWNQLPAIRADKGQMVRLFQNLIGNALKYRSARSVEVTVSAEERGDEVEFRVQDNGIGIEPKYFERIFAIFQRLHTREEYPGTGIGLAVCKRIVERHGGRIWVESVPGHGSTFVFTISKQLGEEP